MLVLVQVHGVVRHVALARFVHTHSVTFLTAGSYPAAGAYPADSDPPNSGRYLGHLRTHGSCDDRLRVVLFPLPEGVLRPGNFLLEAIRILVPFPVTVLRRIHRVLVAPFLLP